MIKFKYLLSIKYLVLLAIIQLTIALLYVNTIGFGVDYWKQNNQSNSYDLQLSRIVIYESSPIIENVETYQKILEDLESSGAKLYYIHFTAVSTKDIDVFDETLIIDKDLALKLEEIGMMDITNENGTTISKVAKDDAFGTCDKIFLTDVFDCNSTEIKVYEKSNVQKESLAFSGYSYFELILSQNVLIEYDGDLDLLFDDILNKYDLELNYKVVSISDSLKTNQAVSYKLIKLDKQNFIAFGIIWVLCIVLSSLIYLNSKQKNISILILLGYNKISIILNMVAISQVSLIIPYIILKINNINAIKEYILIDFMMMSIVMIIMYCLTLELTKEKAKERL